jgi:hypothetical protein
MYNDKIKFFFFVIFVLARGTPEIQYAYKRLYEAPNSWESKTSYS